MRVCVYMPTCHNTKVEVREQLEGSRELNLGFQN